jgi:hypothetical protein
LIALLRVRGKIVTKERGGNSQLKLVADLMLSLEMLVYVVDLEQENKTGEALLRLKSQVSPIEPMYLMN